MLKRGALIHFPVYVWMRLAMEGKGQALDLPSSLRALSSRGRRTPQTIKHVASQGRAARLLLVREVFTSVGCCWSLFRAIICRSEQSIQLRQLQPPLVQASLECLCMSRRAQNRHQQALPCTKTHIHIQTYIQAHALNCSSHMYAHSHTDTDTGMQRPFTNSHYIYIQLQHLIQFPQHFDAMHQTHAWDGRLFRFIFV